MRAAVNLRSGSFAGHQQYRRASFSGAGEPATREATGRSRPQTSGTGSGCCDPAPSQHDATLLVHCMHGRRQMTATRRPVMGSVVTIGFVRVIHPLSQRGSGQGIIARFGSYTLQVVASAIWISRQYPNSRVSVPESEISVSSCRARIRAAPIDISAIGSPSSGMSTIRHCPLGLRRRETRMFCARPPCPAVVAIVMSVRGIAPLNRLSSRSVVVELIRSSPCSCRTLPFGAAGTHVRNATHAGTGRVTAPDAVADRTGRAAWFAPATNRVAVGCKSASNRDPARFRSRQFITRRGADRRRSRPCPEGKSTRQARTRNFNRNGSVRDGSHAP